MAPSSPTPGRYAVLFGCPTGYLHGTDRDLERFTTLLGDHFGFSVKAWPRATRADICTALEGLITTVGTGDSVLIYFSGHGGIGTFEGRLFDDDPQSDHRYLVTVDHPPHEPDSNEPEPGFRGVLDVELGLFARELAWAADNVTCILDCCYATTMIREAIGMPKSEGRRRRYLRPTELEGLAERIARHRAMPAIGRHGLPTTELLASSSEQFAFEQLDADGRAFGVFSEALAFALEIHREPSVTWGRIIDSCGERMAELRQDPRSARRCVLMGPRARRPFSSEEFAGDDEFPVVRDRNGLCVRGGALNGLAIGDTLRVSDPTGLEATISLASVAATHSGAAEFVSTAGGWAVLKRIADPLGVHVPSDLQPELSRSPWLDPHAGPDATLVVTRDGQELHLRRHGAPIRLPHPSTSEGVYTLRRDLEQLARTWRFEQALTTAPAPTLVHGFEWRTIRTRAGQAQVLRDGDELRVGDELHFELAVHGLDHGRALFFNVVELGVSGRLDLLNRAEPTGVVVRSGDDKPLWANTKAEKFEIIWPRDVPGSRGAASFHLLVSDEPLDLHLLIPTSRRQTQDLRNHDLSRISRTIAWGHTRLRYTLCRA